MTDASARRIHISIPVLTRRQVLLGAGFAFMLLWPWILDLPVAFVNDANRAAQYALVATSLVLLTGWVGQISLAQGSFVGIGAMTTALVFRNWGIGFPYSLPIAVLVGAASAALLGVVALRVRGLYLAVATLIFAWMADAWLFSAQWFVGSSGSSSVRIGVIGRENTLPSIDLHSAKAFYILSLAGLALGMLVAISVRDSKTGRAWFAVRGSEMAAASLGVDITRYKLLAFGVSGALAGLAGHLQIVGQGTVVPTEFAFTSSLFYLSVAVVGGLTSLPGAVAAGVLFSALNEIFFRVESLNGYIDIVSGLLLLGVLLAYPGGLAAAGRRLSPMVARLVARARRQAPPADEEEAVSEDAVTLGVADLEVQHLSDEAPTLNGKGHLHRGLPPDREDRVPVLEAKNVTVRFGGLTAVDNVSLVVRQGEIVGLIGPNGAGKTTTFNAISGLNDPTEGEVRIFGNDATKLPVHERAAMGVGRTFQLIQLFPQLDVFDNLLAATHITNPTSFTQHLLVTDASVACERGARARVQQVVEMMGLGHIIHRRVSELPFGVLRTVELARAIVTGSKLIMLDEPASGLDSGETEALANLLRSLRNELDLSLLLIEHDVAMVTSVTDYMYVINRGKLLAEGTPSDIHRNPEVIAAYLGEPTTMEAALA